MLPYCLKTKQAVLQQTCSQARVVGEYPWHFIQPLLASPLLLASSVINIKQSLQSACVRCAATAMRRASNRIPKRSLDTDFELSQVVPHPKGRVGARRGPTGPSKAQKATFTSTGAVVPQGMGDYSRSCLSAAAGHTSPCPNTLQKGQACQGRVRPPWLTVVGIDWLYIWGSVSIMATVMTSVQIASVCYLLQPRFRIRKDQLLKRLCWPDAICIRMCPYMACPL